jgi:SAM-dependent methyltransferase
MVTPETPETPENVWDRHARRWSNLGPPLRPSPQDVEIMQRAVAEHCAAAGRTSTDAVLLGVTPEIVKMQWPRATRLRAFDRNPSMIQHVWPGNPEIEAVAACAIWSSLPVADASADVLLGDASFSNVHYPKGFKQMAEEIRRVLRRGGLFCSRFFAAPAQREPVETVFDDLVHGRIGNFHIFKLRLAAALHDDVRDGVCLGDIWEVWNKAFPDPEALAQKLGWPVETVRTIDSYRSLEARYAFPTVEEIRAVFGEDFTEAACILPDYELGDRSPIMLLVPRG